MHWKVHVRFGGELLELKDVKCRYYFSATHAESDRMNGIHILYLCSCFLPYVYGIFIVSVAGAETAIGLGIFVAFYRLRGSVSIDFDTDSDFIEPIVQQSKPSLTIKNENINTKSIYE
jgi:hypothetical protein